MQVRTETSITTSARALNDHDRPPRRYRPDRLCANHGCDTRLSIYNKSSYCSLHAKDVIRVRGKRARLSP
jgi:hypothetical protein